MMISNSSLILQSTTSSSSSSSIISSSNSTNSTVLCCDDRLQIQRQQLLEIISNIQRDKNRLYFTVGDRNKRVYNYQRDGKTENLKFKRLFRLIQILLKQQQQQQQEEGVTVVTVRDLYYRDVELFHNQNVVRNLLQKDLYFIDLELFNVYSSSKGLYYYDSSFELELVGSSSNNLLQKAEYNCIPFKYTQLKLSSFNSPPLLTVLIVEKVAVFTSLVANNNNNNNNSCCFKDVLLLTPRGYADTCFIKFINNCLLLKSKEVDIKVLFLVDADPYGIHILLDIKRKILSDDVSKLKWIGVDLMELIEYKDLLLKMNKCDYKRAILVLNMLKDDDSSSSSYSDDDDDDDHHLLSLELLLTVQRMMWYGVKAEIDVLHEINESDYGHEVKQEGLVEYVRRKVK